VTAYFETGFNYCFGKIIVIVNGEVVPLLLSVVSKHTKPIKVVGLEGRFTQPQDFSMIFRNVRFERIPLFLAAFISLIS
jgi:hypothetical protein